MSYKEIILLISGVAALLIAILYNVIHDYKIWKRQVNLPQNIRRHKRGWRLKAATCVLPVILLSLASNFMWLVAWITSIGLCGAWFIVLFDGGYNIRRGESFFFRGTEDGSDDAKTDNFWQSIPQWLHIGIKLILIVSTSWIYIIGLTK